MTRKAALCCFQNQCLTGTQGQCRHNINHLSVWHVAQEICSFILGKALLTLNGSTSCEHLNYWMNLPNTRFEWGRGNVTLCLVVIIVFFKRVLISWDCKSRHLNHRLYSTWKATALTSDKSNNFGSATRLQWIYLHFLRISIYQAASQTFCIHYLPRSLLGNILSISFCR